jgi:hypothetical protein
VEHGYQGNQHPPYPLSHHDCHYSHSFIYLTSCFISRGGYVGLHHEVCDLYLLTSSVHQVFIYWPLPTRYLILAVDALEFDLDEFINVGSNTSRKVTGGVSSVVTPVTSQYRSCMIGVPNRSALWIMTRSTVPLSDRDLATYYAIAEQHGYENVSERVMRVPFVDV